MPGHELVGFVQRFVGGARVGVFRPAQAVSRFLAGTLFAVRIFALNVRAGRAVAGRA